MKKILIILFTLSALLFSVGSKFAQEDIEYLLIESLSNTDAKLQDIELHIVFEEPVNYLQLEEIIHISNSADTDNKSIYPLDNKKIIFNKNPIQDIMSISVILKDIKDIDYINKLSKKIENEIKVKDRFFIVEGYYPQELNPREMEYITEQIMEKLQGRIIESGYIQENFLWVSGYSNKINESITTGGNKLNLNIALKYNSSQDQTHIILGTPLIYGEY